MCSSDLPVSRRGKELGRAQIVRPHRHHIPGMDRVHRPGVDAIDPDAVFRTGEPGYGVGREVELRLKMCRTQTPFSSGVTV